MRGQCAYVCVFLQQKTWVSDVTAIVREGERGPPHVLAYLVDGGVSWHRRRGMSRVRSRAQ